MDNPLGVLSMETHTPDALLVRNVLCTKTGRIGLDQYDCPCGEAEIVLTLATAELTGGLFLPLNRVLAGRLADNLRKMVDALPPLKHGV